MDINIPIADKILLCEAKIKSLKQNVELQIKQIAEIEEMLKNYKQQYLKIISL